MSLEDNDMSLEDNDMSLEDNDMSNRKFLGILLFISILTFSIPNNNNAEVVVVSVRLQPDSYCKDAYCKGTGDAVVNGITVTCTFTDETAMYGFCYTYSGLTCLVEQDPKLRSDIKTKCVGTFKDNAGVEFTCSREYGRCLSGISTNP